MSFPKVLEQRRRSSGSKTKDFMLTLGTGSSSLHLAILFGKKNEVCEIIKDNADVNSLDRCGRTPLFDAVYENHQELVEILLKADARIDIQDNKKRTVLHYGAEKGNNGCLKHILHSLDKFKNNKDRVEGEYDENLAHDIDGVTPLHLAAKLSSAKCIQSLLKYSLPWFTGACDSTDAAMRTPLHWAAAHGYYECLSQLLKNGSNCLLPDAQGRLPLHYAAVSTKDGSKNCLQSLLSVAPYNINNKDEDGATALHFAVMSENLAKLQLFFNKYKRFCDVNATDNQHMTALHLACARGAVSVVKTLLSHEADVNMEDINGATPVHIAALNNKAQVIITLVQNPLTAELSTIKDESAVHWAAAVGANAVILCLYQHGGDILRKDGTGATPLHIAAMNNHSSTVDIFMKLNVPVNIRANNECTPLHYAAEGGSVKVVKQLLKSGASIDAVDNEKKTALHYSVLGGHLHLSQLFIEAGIPVDAKDMYGRTPLHFAAVFAFTDVLCLLLENRANVNSKDNQGKTALHFSCEKGNNGTVKALLEFRAYPNFIDCTVERMTPLDYCLQGSRFYIASSLKDAGAVSSSWIFMNAAVLIQSYWRGYYTRKYLMAACQQENSSKQKSKAGLKIVEGKTALHFSCEKGNNGTVKALLEFRAYPNFIDCTVERMTPLDYCLQGSRFYIASSLKDAGAVSSSWIFMNAAVLIQSYWRGYYTRKYLMAACQQENSSKQKSKAGLKIVEKLSNDMAFEDELAHRIEEYLKIDHEEFTSEEEECYNEIDLDCLPKYPVYVTDNLDGTQTRMLDYNGYLIKLSTEEEMERWNRAVDDIQVVEVSPTSQDEDDDSSD